MEYLYLIIIMILPSILKIIKAYFFKLIFKKMKFKDYIEYEKHSKRNFPTLFSNKKINDG